MSKTGSLLIVSSRAPFGNKEPYLRTEIFELAKHFARLAIVPVRSPAGPLQDLPANVEVLAWPVASPAIAGRALKAVAAAPAAVRKVLTSLAVSHDPGRGKNAAVILKALALADWVRQHGFEHIHAYWLSTPATVAMVAARVAGIPWSATAHRWDIYERNAFDVKARDATFIRTISERGRDDLRAAMPSMSARIVRIPIGAAIPDLRENATTVPALRLVCPAALVPVKGHFDLLSALVLLRERGVPFHCTLAGEGPLREQLRERINDLELHDAVTVAGFVEQQRLHEWYRSGTFDAVVLASRHAPSGEMEGIPSALVEAMAYGVPVVATDSGSVPELIGEDCGFLVPAGDAGALARALEDVYLRPQEAAVRARRAHARVADEHDVCNRMRDFAAAIGGERVMA